MIKVVEVSNKKLLKKFIYFPLKLYKKVKEYTPPIFEDDFKDFDKKRNPNYVNCDTKSFLAYKDGKIVGRICALFNPVANKKYQNRRLRFRHYDVIDDIEVSKALFKEVIKYAKSLNLDEIEGPNGFTDFDKEGLLIEGFNEKNIFITYYNYPYYKKHLEALGFKKMVDWKEFRLTLPFQEDEKLKRISSLVRKKGFELLKFKSYKELYPYLDEAFQMYNEAFCPLYGTTELNSNQIRYYMGSFLPLLNMDYISIVIDKNKKIVGFAAVVPSLSKATTFCKGKLFPFGWISILHALKHNDTIDMLLIAVKPEYQGMGINAILMYEIHKACLKYNIKYAETGPELEYNEKVISQWNNYNANCVRKRRLFINTVDILERKVYE